MDIEAQANDDQQWMEIRWVVATELVDIANSFLFAIGAEGVQEDYVEGECPPPKQPWDIDKTVIEPARKVLISWWNLEVAEQIEQNWNQLLEEHDLQSFSFGKPEFCPYIPQDWSQKWTMHFQRHQISDDVAISPPWLAQDGDIIIEPGIAFGTGEHPTTHACMKALAQWISENPSLQNQKCLDVGCGSGILSLVAAALGMFVDGIDIEEDAIEVAYQNAIQNSLQHKVQFECRDISTVEGQYPVVVANLYAEVLVALCDDIVRLATGKIALAGILVAKEEMVLQVYAPHCSLIHRYVDGDWVSLWFERNL